MHYIIDAMNTLPLDKKIMILSALTDGASVRATSRMTGCHIVTILRLLCKTGTKCEAIMDAHMRSVWVEQIQCDELWTYCYKKENKLRPEDNGHMGDRYIFIALEADTKLVVWFELGKRDLKTATALMKQLRDRTIGQFQLTTDAFPGFKYAVADTFGWNSLDYAQLTKSYATPDFPVHEGYLPSNITQTKKTTVMGRPDPNKISTSYVERLNLSTRTSMRRLNRLTLGFSKKLENLKAALWLNFVRYNFMAIHGTLKTTPAIKAKITDHVWDWGEVLDFETNGNLRQQ